MKSCCVRGNNSIHNPINSFYITKCSRGKVVYFRVNQDKLARNENDQEGVGVDTSELEFICLDCSGLDNLVRSTQLLR